MTSKKFLNRARMKAQKIGERLASNTQFSARKAKILTDRYSTLSKRAETMDKTIAEHMAELHKSCEQDWMQGLGAELSISANDTGLGFGVVPVDALAIMYVPRDEKSKKHVDFLIGTLATNKGLASESKHRLSILGFSADKKVMKYFQELKTNGSFHRLFDIYKSALLLQNQGANEEKIGRFLKKKISAVVDVHHCPHRTARGLFKYCKASLILFDITMQNDFVLRKVGVDSEPITVETALQDAVMLARDSRLVFGMLETIVEDDAKDSKERFDKIMEQIKETRQES